MMRRRSRWWRRLRIVRKLRETIAALTKLLLIALAVSFVGLVGLHWYNRVPLGEAVRMPVDDYRVTATCMNHPYALKQFLNRHLVFEMFTGFRYSPTEDICGVDTRGWRDIIAADDATMED